MTDSKCTNLLSPVIPIASRGVIGIDRYVDDLFEKLNKPGLDTHWSCVSMFDKSFDCTCCSVLCKDAAVRVTKKFKSNQYYILPPLGYNGTTTAILRLYDFYIYSFENGPIIPILTSLENQAITRSNLIELYGSNGVNSIIQTALKTVDVPKLQKLID